MKMCRVKARIWLGMWSLCLMAGAHGQALPGAMAQKTQQTASSQQQRAASAMVGEYDLISSSNSPLWHWKMIKGRLSVKRIDDRHVLISLACVWSDRLNVLCAE